MNLTRRSVIPLLAAGPAALRAYAALKPQAERLYIGTYTSPAGAIPGGEGIYTATFNPATGELTPPTLAAATPDPTFLALSPNAPARLYAVNELGGGKPGTVTAFTRNDATGALTALNTVPAGGKGPCHVATEHTGRAVFVANYPGGSISSYTVTSEGLSSPVATIQYTGSGPKPEQASPHAHCVDVSPDNRFLVVSDLGTDRLLTYHLDPASAELIPAATPLVTVTPGSGPRHTLFHPNGKWLYSLNELSSTVDLFEWTAATGSLTFKATASTLPEEARGKKNSTAELAFSPDGRFLYVSNRFHDSIAVFSVDHDHGTLASIQDIPCGGKVPRSFTLNPSGSWLLVANQDTANIAIFARNAQTGILTPTGRSYAVNRPVCLLFA